jgi:hypothetical protein
MKGMAIKHRGISKFIAALLLGAGVISSSLAQQSILK